MVESDGLEAGMVFEYSAWEDHDVDQRWMEIKDIEDDGTVVLMFEDEDDTARTAKEQFNSQFPNWELAACTQ